MPARRRVYTLPTPPLMPQPIIQPDRKPRYHLPHARPNRLRADLTPWPQRERDADQRERDADQRERDAYQRGDHDGLRAGAAPAVVGSGAGQLLPQSGELVPHRRGDYLEPVGADAESAWVSVAPVMDVGSLKYLRTMLPQF